MIFLFLEQSMNAVSSFTWVMGGEGGAGPAEELKA